MQTFPLKGATGDELKAEPRAGARAKTPRPPGDVLHQRLGGVPGFLYWTGAGHGWFPEGSR